MGDGDISGLTNGSDEPQKRRRGRPKGVPNRATRDVRQAAQKYSARALTTLAKFLAHEDPKVALLAANSILDRGHGKPSEHRHTELTGKDGAPLGEAAPLTNHERARRMLFILSKAAHEKLGGGLVPHTGDGLHRVLNDEPWSPDEPEEVAAREKMYRTTAKASLPPPPAEPPAEVNEPSWLKDRQPRDKTVVWLDERGKPGMDWGHGGSGGRTGPPPNVITRKPS